LGDFGWTEWEATVIDVLLIEACVSAACSCQLHPVWHFDPLQCHLSEHLTHNGILLVFQFSALTGTRRVGHANGQHQNGQAGGPVNSGQGPPPTTPPLLVIIAFFPRHLQILSGILLMKFEAESQRVCLRMLLCSVHFGCCNARWNTIYNEILYIILITKCWPFWGKHYSLLKHIDFLLIYAKSAASAGNFQN